MNKIHGGKCYFRSEYCFMRSILAVIRIISVFIIILAGVTVLAIMMPFTSRKFAHRVFMALKGLMLWVVGVRVHGPEFETIQPGMIMANHRSYLDVLFIPTKRLFTIVGKVEVRSWPVIGWAARALGVIWVKRESKESRRSTRDYIVKAMKRGETVVLFPEGTSGEGPTLLPLKPGMFFECAKHNFPIYQWSLHFDNAKTAFPPGISFIKHLWAICREWHINAYIEIRQQPLQSNNGEELIEDAKYWWNNSLIGLSKAHPAKHSGYWPDDRKLEVTA